MVTVAAAAAVVAVSAGIVASSCILAFVAAAAAGTSAANTVGIVPAVDIADIAVIVGHIVVVAVAVDGCMTVAFAAIVADSGAAAGIDIASFDCRLVGSESTQIVHYFAQDTELLIDHFGPHLAQLDNLCLAVAL